MCNIIKLTYKRVLLKISGEVLNGINTSKFNISFIKDIADDIKKLLHFGIEFSIVIGGGNLFRGSSLSSFGLNRIVSDRVGMLSTVINGLLLNDIFSQFKIRTYLMSSISVKKICADYCIEKSLDLLSKKYVLIFCGGLGHPFFTTDSAACLRAIETNSDIFLKGTKVNGIYSEDPSITQSAILYNQLNYQEVLQKELKVMDLTAFILARDHNLPIGVFNMYHTGALKRILTGCKEGTIITG
ncbi:Uridylate kinase [Buchnera aphidicola (Symydobius americanus)]